MYVVQINNVYTVQTKCMQSRQYVRNEDNNTWCRINGEETGINKIKGSVDRRFAISEESVNNYGCLGILNELIHSVLIVMALNTSNTELNN